jgi:hypothetical protein
MRGGRLSDRADRSLDNARWVVFWAGLLVACGCVPPHLPSLFTGVDRLSLPRVPVACMDNLQECLRSEGFELDQERLVESGTYAWYYRRPAARGSTFVILSWRWTAPLHDRRVEVDILDNSNWFKEPDLHAQSQRITMLIHRIAEEQACYYGDP